MAKHQRKNNSFGLKHAVVTLAFASIVAVGGTAIYQIHEANKERIELAKQKAQADSLRSVVKHPVQNIVYHVDTLEQKSSALLYHRKGEITRNFVANQNMYRMQLSLFVHEKWHHHNYLLGFRSKYKFKPDEYYKLCLHDEITATMAALLTSRYQYMESNDKKDFLRRYRKGIYGFYYDAVAKGEINPYDTSPEAREKEWRLIANGTRQMWMDKLYSHYQKNSYTMLLNYLSIHGLVQDSRKNYSYIVGKMYTIGGVNFWNYMNEDIPIEDNRVLLADEIRKVQSLHKGGRFVTEMINNQADLLKDVGYEKQQEAFQHLLISSKLKYMLRRFTASDIVRNPHLISSYYHRLLANVYHDKEFKNLVDDRTAFVPNRAKIHTNAEDYENVLKELYSVQGVDLRTIIEDFNAERVPVKKAMDFGFIPDTRWIDMNVYGLYLEEPMSAVHEATITQRTDLPASKKPLPSPLQQPKNSPSRRKGQSEDFTISAPNFWEPILLNESPEVLQQINKCIADFNAIPEVDKGCNLEAQRAFHMQQEQNSGR